MIQVTATFQSLSDFLDGSRITGRGLHGMVFDLLRRVDEEEAEWLHVHPSPKPFSLAALYTEQGALAGVRLTAVQERAGRLLASAWQEAQRQALSLHLGRQEFTVGEVICAPGPTYYELANCPPHQELTLHFLSPTAFKQGPGNLPLPLPGNVFNWPFRVWQAFCPPELALPDDWPAWCQQDVFVASHDIKTATVAISLRESFTGFVGWVKFHTLTNHPQADTYLRIWQGLGRLIAFCGVGHKTTMGMGVVEWSSPTHVRAER